MWSLVPSQHNSVAKCARVWMFTTVHTCSWQHCVSFALLRKGKGRQPEHTVFKEHLLASLPCANWNSNLIFSSLL